MLLASHEADGESNTRRRGFRLTNLMVDFLKTRKLRAAFIDMYTHTHPHTELRWKVEVAISRTAIPYHATNTHTGLGSLKNLLGNLFFSFNIHISSFRINFKIF